MTKRNKRIGALVALCVAAASAIGIAGCAEQRRKSSYKKRLLRRLAESLWTIRVLTRKTSCLMPCWMTREP